MPMLNKDITREMVYLCTGEDLELIDTMEIYYNSFKGVKYYTVGENRIIGNGRQLFCSCNETYCWHILKVALDESKAKRKET